MWIIVCNTSVLGNEIVYYIYIFNFFKQYFTTLCNRDFIVYDIMNCESLYEWVGSGQKLSKAIPVCKLWTVEDQYIYLIFYNILASWVLNVC